MPPRRESKRRSPVLLAADFHPATTAPRMHRSDYVDNGRALKFCHQLSVARFAAHDDVRQPFGHGEIPQAGVTAGVIQTILDRAWRQLSRLKTVVQGEKRQTPTVNWKEWSLAASET